MVDAGRQMARVDGLPRVQVRLVQALDAAHVIDCYIAQLTVVVLDEHLIGQRQR